MQTPQQNLRPWWWDALTAVAFLGNALVGGKFMTRALGPVAGLFVFAILGGLGYLFARSAWHSLLQKRNGR